MVSMCVINDHCYISKSAVRDSINDCSNLNDSERLQQILEECACAQKQKHKTKTKNKSESAKITHVYAQMSHADARTEIWEVGSSRLHRSRRCRLPYMHISLRFVVSVAGA